MAHDITEITERKFSILFDWFDHTDDDWLTRADFEQMADVFTAVARPDDHENRGAMREAFMAWWDVLRDIGAVDAQERVGRREFIEAMRTGVTEPKNFERLILGIVDALMRALDTDGSGELSGDEYVRMYQALGIPPETSSAAFRRLDRNGSGSISHDEFRTAIEEFYLGTDPEAPGNWLLGNPLSEG
ncbi:EF-hand domain-containing protein [Saccharothrix syringae]|uniref:Calcium-binding protein n=1 Tax=Saccharothrix syringae TaxID=103733 RepID=A0A5Q0H0L5_SACSY|nr:EF-hand domain-containing protein [Saccharothrix syringae]QFZ19709.1 calcium-binding protein [Saccharothrix syringae]